MRNLYKSLGCLAVLAASVAFGLPAYAQQAVGTSAPQATPGGKNSAWSEERTERRDLREEREKIRAEHEDLEAQRDRLKARCMDAKGQDRSQCEADKKALQAKREALHERMKTLHAKMEADRQQHGGPHQGKWQGQGTTKPSGSTPAATPATPAPAAQ